MLEQAIEGQDPSLDRGVGNPVPQKLCHDLNGPNDLEDHADSAGQAQIRGSRTGVHIPSSNE